MQKERYIKNNEHRMNSYHTSSGALRTCPCHRCVFGTAVALQPDHHQQCLWISPLSHWVLDRSHPYGAAPSDEELSSHCFPQLPWAHCLIWKAIKKGSGTSTAIVDCCTCWQVTLMGVNFISSGTGGSRAGVTTWSLWPPTSEASA